MTKGLGLILLTTKFYYSALMFFYIFFKIVYVNQTFQFVCHVFDFLDGLFSCLMKHKDLKYLD